MPIPGKLDVLLHTQSQREASQREDTNLDWLRQLSVSRMLSAMGAADSTFCLTDRVDGQQGEAQAPRFPADRL